jgi:hypothetical protein
MMKSPLYLAAPLSLLLALGACQQETIDPNADDRAEAANVANAAASMEAPPMIQASRTYRCKDNSLRGFLHQRHRPGPRLERSARHDVDRGRRGPALHR